MTSCTINALTIGTYEIGKPGLVYKNNSVAIGSLC